MNRTAYENDPQVRSFLDWAAPLITGERPLHHAWNSPKWGLRTFETVHGAFVAYDWPFSVTLPGESEPRRGRSYDDTIAVLSDLTDALRTSAANEDAGTFLEAAIAVVRWGGVRRNEMRLRELGANALPDLGAAAEQLRPTVADLDRLDRVRDMNAGFSKIYSLLIDGFPIYDSRVACALASLVRLYCEERDLRSVPPLLEFGIPASRGNMSRDPSAGDLRFPRLWAGHPRPYAVSNLKAAWLLDALAEKSPFAELDSKHRLFAIESAMFMIGYAPVRTLAR